MAGGGLGRRSCEAMSGATHGDVPSPPTQKAKTEPKPDILDAQALAAGWRLGGMTSTRRERSIAWTTLMLRA